MIPVADTNHVAEGLALLTGMFANATNVRGMLQSLLVPIQDLDNMVFATISGRLLQNAVGDAVDKIGSIVGEPRLGRDDADYKIAIQIRILVNNSQGKAEDLIKIAAFAFGDGDFTYDDGFEPASWQLTALDTVGFPFISKDFHDAKAAGTRGVVVYSTWPTDEDFVYGSVYGAVANAKGYSSIYGAPAVSGKYVTSVQV